MIEINKIYNENNYAFLIKDENSLNNLESLLYDSIPEKDYEDLYRVITAIKINLRLGDSCWLYVNCEWSYASSGYDLYRVIKDPNDNYNIEFIIIDSINYIRKLKIEKLNENR